MAADQTSSPFAVFLATMVGWALALGLLIFGVIGFFADQVSDPFGGGLIALGLLVSLASWLTSRGNNVGRLILGALAAVTIAIGLYYAFTGPTYAIVPALVTAAVAGGTAALLFVPQSSKRYFSG
jgi:hypothetical protein